MDRELNLVKHEIENGNQVFNSEDIKEKIASENVLEIYQALIIIKKYRESFKVQFVIDIIPKMLNVLSITQITPLICEILEIFSCFNQEENFLQTIGQNNCSQVLIQLLHTTNYCILEGTVPLISLLCRSADYIKIIKQNSVIQLLIASIWRQKEERQQKIILGHLTSIFKDILMTISDFDQSKQIFFELLSLMGTYSRLIQASNDQAILKNICHSILLMAIYSEKIFFESKIAVKLIELFSNNQKQAIFRELLQPLIHFSQNRENSIYLCHLGIIRQIEKLVKQKLVGHFILGSMLFDLTARCTNFLYIGITQSEIIVTYLFQGLQENSPTIHYKYSRKIIDNIIQFRMVEPLISFGLLNQLIDNIQASYHLKDTMRMIKKILLIVDKSQNDIYIKKLREIQGELLLNTKNQDNEILKIAKKIIKMIT